MTHLERCLALMNRYLEQGRSSASIGRMLKAVGAERYMTPWEIQGMCVPPPPPSWVWTLRGFIRETW